MWYEEKKIKKIIENWLDKKGFDIKPGKKDQIHGVDIQRENKKRCRYWFIECKGYPSKNFKKKKGKKSESTRLAQRYIWFISALGQIALRMKQKYGNYGVAFPDNEYFKNKILDKDVKNKTYIKIFRKRLKIHFFLVNEKKEIFQLTPCSKKFKRIARM